MYVYIVQKGFPKWDETSMEDTMWDGYFMIPLVMFWVWRLLSWNVVGLVFCPILDKWCALGKL